MAGNKVKKIHLANLIRGDGMVSALCFVKPRPINLASETWTQQERLVTCKKCKLLQEKD